MGNIISQIIANLKELEGKAQILDYIFGNRKQDILKGKELVLFGAGELGQEILYMFNNIGINPVCFCDNNLTKEGSEFCGLPVITFETLKNKYHNCFVLVSTQKHNKVISNQLLDNDFNLEHLFCTNSNPSTQMIYMFAMVGTQNLLTGYQEQANKQPLLEILVKNTNQIQQAWTLLEDQKSKDLLVSKLTLLASEGDFNCFREFITDFSEPLNEFGGLEYEGTPEDYYYFHNDVYNLSPHEILVDVGAYDGDSIETFIQECEQNRINYEHIYAFEPDPKCFEKLLANTQNITNVTNLKLGLWSESKTLHFITSENAIHDQAGIISDKGKFSINVVSLDDYLKGRPVTIIKMDPSGNVIPEALQGAKQTIKQYSPILILGAYHALESIFEIPLLVHSICPDYKLFLRHNTYHLCDTDLYAVKN